MATLSVYMYVSIMVCATRRSNSRSVYIQIPQVVDLAVAEGDIRTELYCIIINYSNSMLFLFVI